MKKIIAVAVPKGGVGKTTTAVNLSASLAIADKKVLLIDFDPSGACSIYLGFNKQNVKADIFDVFTFTRSIEQAIHKTELENLDFIPAKAETVLKEDRISRITDNPFLFRHFLEKEIINQYDYIIIDCPPYLRGLTTIAMITAHSVLIPVRAGQFSISALKKIYDYIIEVRRSNNSRLTIEGVLLNMYEPRTMAWVKTDEQLNQNFGKYLFKTTIPKSIALAEAEFYGKPAILVKANSPGAAAYLQLANEIIFRNSVWD